MARNRLISVAVLSGLALSGCAGSGRFDAFPGFGPSAPPRRATAPQPEEAPMPIPQTGPVVSEPLPPPAYPGSAPSPTVGGPPQSEPLPPPSAPAPPSVAASPAPSPGSRGSAVGTWTARDATGSTCRVTLSSASALDLYKASASGCANRDLQRVNAWKQDGGEIYLYSAGSVVARVPASGGGGVLARSGAPVTLSR